MHILYIFNLLPICLFNKPITLLQQRKLLITLIKTKLILFQFTTQFHHTTIQLLNLPIFLFHPLHMYLINLFLFHCMASDNILVFLCKDVVLFLSVMELLLQMLVLLLFLLEFLCVGVLLLLDACFCAKQLCGELSVGYLEICDVFGQIVAGQLYDLIFVIQIIIVLLYLYFLLDNRITSTLHLPTSDMQFPNLQLQSSHLTLQPPHLQLMQHLILLTTLLILLLLPTHTLPNALQLLRQLLVLVLKFLGVSGQLYVLLLELCYCVLVVVVCCGCVCAVLLQLVLQLLQLFLFIVSQCLLSLQLIAQINNLTFQTSHLTFIILHSLYILLILQFHLLRQYLYLIPHGVPLMLIPTLQLLQYLLLTCELDAEQFLQTVLFLFISFCYGLELLTMLCYLFRVLCLQLLDMMLVLEFCYEVLLYLLFVFGYLVNVGFQLRVCVCGGVILC